MLFGAFDYVGSENYVPDKAPEGIYMKFIKTLFQLYLEI
ncbi:hypothetical protein ADIARSV_1249 [Arcticibacter svalbardensis MN12-7]|uniref:Uncharacterized protein n=1 Tax=Arcticibacter svalbardensis MN12-7 TaxID=1150600 RepID=R9GV15_9SPHI|nr:hypothetical protein ADIARSV_1249 [Arcticibacter svalbardensis MN12-7]